MRHGREGLLVAPGRPAAVAAALAVLRDDPGRRAAMGAAARERVLRAYTLERCLDALEAVYAGEAPCAC